MPLTSPAPSGFAAATTRSSMLAAKAREIGWPGRKFATVSPTPPCTNVRREMRFLMASLPYCR